MLTVILFRILFVSVSVITFDWLCFIDVITNAIHETKQPESEEEYHCKVETEERQPHWVGEKGKEIIHHDVR